ncbi:MAG: hypothetical protein HUJ97_04345 [Bacteroidales bacterium]|nr:hypothetical protein [Bacteroidales bacterium]
MFFYFLSSLIHAYCQQDSISEWQEQLISRIDADEFSEKGWERLMEMLGDLELNKGDTLFPLCIRQNIILRSDLCLNIREGYHNVTPDKIAQNKAYRGDFWNHVIRYKIQAGKDWSGGFVLSKDAGECFRRSFPFFDSFNYYVSYKPSQKKGIIERVLLGRYNVKLGSGLILNQRFSLGKALSLDSFMHNGTAFAPHSSTDEYNYMQGVATELNMGNWNVAPFFSYKKLDAVLENDTITSIPTDGLHRTNAEDYKRNKADVINAGFHAGYTFSWAEIGANVLYSRLSHTFFRPYRKYNTNYFRGNQLFQASLDYHLRLYGFELRGETALDQAFHLATINQVSHSIGEDWRASVLFRYMHKEYQQLYGASATESSSLQGEHGAMVSLEGEPLAHWKVNVLFDYFHLTNIPYGYETPLNGYELRLQTLYSQKHINLTLSYRLKYKEAFRHGIDCIFSFTPLNGLKLKTQLRSKIYSSPQLGGYSFGYAASQAVEWNKENSPCSCEIQGTWFNAKDYDTRLYLSEKNLLYGFGLPMLYGKGIRGSATASWKILPRLILELKYSVFHYLDRDAISSGLQAIWGRNQQNLWMQVRIKI